MEFEENKNYHRSTTGIHLHRAIDSFTDQHPTFKQHCKLLSLTMVTIHVVIMMLTIIFYRTMAAIDASPLEEFAKTLC